MKQCTRCRETLPADEFYPHPTTPTGLTARCKTCSRAAKKESREKHPVTREQRREYVTRYRQKNSDRVRVLERRVSIRSRFGITADAYDAMLEAQGGVCAICKEPESARVSGTVRALAVDHDRSCCPGKKSCGTCVRGLLCSRCNTAIGLLSDDAERMKSAAAYVTRRVQC